jgi:hypothetical protein
MSLSLTVTVFLLVRTSTRISRFTCSKVKEKDKEVKSLWGVSTPLRQVQKLKGWETVPSGWAGKWALAPQSSPQCGCTGLAVTVDHWPTWYLHTEVPPTQRAGTGLKSWNSPRDPSTSSLSELALARKGTGEFPLISQQELVCPQNRN